MRKATSLFLFLLFLMSQMSCGKRNAASPDNNQSDVIVLHITHSALVDQIKQNNLASKDKLNSCRNHISDVICLVDPLKHPIDYDNYDTLLFNRPCLSGGEKYVSIFQNHFDHSSKMIQKMYCSLEKIWIENNFSATAYATPIYDKYENIIAGAIGIKRDFLDSSLDIDKFLSIKEEATFGGSANITTADKSIGLIKYTTSQKNNKLFLISHALNHEFGHLFDYANRLNLFSPDCDQDNHPENCKPLPGSWGEISWMTNTTPLSENDFSLRDKLCFYSCRGKTIAPPDSVLLFHSLINTGFHSTYAAISPREDWAETFAYYIENEEGFKIKVETQGNSFNLSEHFNSDKLEAKRKFVKNFMNGNYIYPGQSFYITN